MNIKNCPILHGSNLEIDEGTLAVLASVVEFELAVIRSRREDEALQVGRHARRGGAPDHTVASGGSKVPQTHGPVGGRGEELVGDGVHADVDNLRGVPHEVPDVLVVVQGVIAKRVVFLRVLARLLDLCVVVLEVRTAGQSPREGCGCR